MTNETPPRRSETGAAESDDWTKRTGAAYAHYQNHCAIKGQMPLPWDALTQAAKNYWMSKADASSATSKTQTPTI